MGSDCQHHSFRAEVRVQRLTQDDGGPVTHYNAEVEITCADCGLAFEFCGLPIGVDPYRPTVGFGALELRVPIMPPGEKIPHGLPTARIVLESETQH